MNKESQIIEECREIFGDAPRQIKGFELWKASLSVPFWAIRSLDFRFFELYRDQWKLLKNGRVVWGRLIQANELLYRRGFSSHPATIVYSLDPQVDSYTEILDETAVKLFGLRGKQLVNPQLQILADKLEDEMVMDMKLLIPPSFTEGIECFYACIMVDRKHLPTKRLSYNRFPILVNPEQTNTTMMLPYRYWSESMVLKWVYDI
ncbi:MAG: hypothetical protein ACIAQZ_04955 [Sedimentisphaeraceae bacterium JB056]